MSKTYSQILKQIDALHKEAEALRVQEVGQVVSQIRAAIDVYKLTAADLGLGKAPSATKAKSTAASPFKRAAVKPGKAKKGAGQVKFRNDSGGTWGGIGKRPQWLRDAINSGKQLSDFAVK